MGLDINMHIIDKDGNFIAEDIFDGRNSEWFHNLMGDSSGWDDEYEELIMNYYFPDNIPDKVKEEMEWSFSPRSIIVEDYLDWYAKYKPFLHAGWVHKHDAWKIKNKGYIPEEVQHYLYEEDIIEDMEFIEYENKYDCNIWLSTYILENKIPRDAIIIYHFNN